MPRTAAWLGGAAIGVVGYGLSLALFIGSMRRLGVARSAALFGTYPFVGVLASALVLGERLSPWTALAGVVIAAGAALLVIERRT
jgi:drug/metabolite transporter (DMT)-like permease